MYMLMYLTAEWTTQVLLAAVERAESGYFGVVEERKGRKWDGYQRRRATTSASEFGGEIPGGEWRRL